MMIRTIDALVDAVISQDMTREEAINWFCEQVELAISDARVDEQARHHVTRVTTTC